MKKFFLALVAIIVGLVGLGAILLAAGIDTDIPGQHKVLAFIAWVVFCSVAGLVCRHLSDKWGVSRPVSVVMNLVMCFTVLFGFCAPEQLFKVVFVVAGVILMAFVCLIRYLIRRWMAWLKAV
jgi:hypothetical protein